MARDEYLMDTSRAQEPFRQAVASDDGASECGESQYTSGNNADQAAGRAKAG